MLNSEFFKQIAKYLDEIITDTERLSEDEKSRLTSFFYFFKSKHDDLNKERFVENALKYCTKKYSEQLVQEIKIREKIITELVTLDRTIESEIIQMIKETKGI